MTSETEDVAVLIFSFAWAILHHTNPAMKHPRYATVFATEQLMQLAFNNCNLKFATGLADVLKAAAPPTIDYFKTLRVPPGNLWAVYALVLEKDGYDAHLYSGSGTAVTGRVRYRLSTYDSRSAGHMGGPIPVYVEKLLKDGYAITHKGLLCWCPIPWPLLRSAARNLFLLLETVFALCFWAMVSNDTDYYMPALCPWDRADFTYRGACTHFSIREGMQDPSCIPTKDPRSPKEIKVVCQERDRLFKKMRIAMYQAYKAKNLAEQNHKCKACVLTFPNNARLQEHYRTETHRIKMSGKPKVHKGRGGSQHNIKTKKWWCGICKHAAATEERLDIHLKGVRHHKKLRVLGLSDST